MGSASKPRSTTGPTARLSIAILCLLPAAGTPTLPAQDTGAPVRRALLIGIDDYKAVPNLMGAGNDIVTIREILRNRWGFQDQNIEVLTNAAATREGILTALNRLVRTAGPDDIVYVHYSGHGSQVRDRNGDEPDGLDETLVPHDGRTPGVRDIVDDELDALFARLRARSALIVLDSCHSGTATRSIDIRTRSIPADTRDELYAAAEELRTRAVVPVPGERFLVLGAAASNQEALDGPVDGRYHGFFSYALARSVATQPIDAPATAIFAGIGRELGRIQQRFGRIEMPQPQLEGPPALFDRPLMPPIAPPSPPAMAMPAGTSAAPASRPTGAPRLAFATVTPMPPDRVILARGTALGGVPGSRWAVYPPTERQFLPGRALAMVTVVGASGIDAIARIGTSVGPVPPGARAVLLLPPPALQRIPIRIGNVSPALRARLTEILSRDVVNVAMVGEDEPARFVIDAAGDRLQLTTADGLRVVREFPSAGSAAGAAIAAELGRSAAADELLSLDNPAANLRLDAQLVVQPALATRGVTVVADTSAARFRVRREGAPRTPDNSLQIEVRVDAEAFLTIASVDSQGAVNLLFPNEYARAGFLPGGRVAAGAAVRIPDSLEAGNRAGFHWDYAPPTGTDTIRVFASTDAETAELLRSRIRAMQAAGAGTLLARGGPGRRLADEAAALRDQLAALSTRGIQTVAASTPVASPSPASTGPDLAGDWAATSLTVSVTD